MAFTVHCYHADVRHMVLLQHFKTLPTMHRVCTSGLNPEYKPRGDEVSRFEF